MIDLPRPEPRMRSEPLLPLIDVVFFLVVAFMMVSHLTVARPFDVALPDSALRQTAEGEFTLFLSPYGEVGYMAPQALTGEAALAALSAARASHCLSSDCATAPPVLRIAADAAGPAPALAALLPQLQAMGFGAVRLVTSGG